MKLAWYLLFFVVLSAAAAARAVARTSPLLFQDVRIEQRLGATLPLDAEFRDQFGAPVRLGDYFGAKPVLLMPVYYTCPNICSEALQGLVEGISPLPLHPGRDFEIVAFSFNAAESPAEARAKLDEVTMNYAGRHGSPGWHFLTGGPQAIAALTQAIGFHYRYDAAHSMFIHASGLVVASSAGTISSYQPGAIYEPQDIENAIFAARQQRTVGTKRAANQLCYPFGPATGRYNALVIQVVRLAAISTVLAILFGLVLLWRTDLRRHRSGVSARAFR